MFHTIIEFNNISFIIKKELDESKEQFYARSWYISKLQPKNDKEFNEAIVKSKIWSNINYLENTYTEEITKSL